MKKLLTLVSLIVMASLVLTACGGSASTASDLLGAIEERGYILVSSDLNYEPQSFPKTDGTRPGDTVCPSDALTSEEIQGFDVDVAVAVGEALGVETCFVTPDWDLITAGSWADKWDVSIGSMTVTTARQQALDFSTPYYYTTAVIAVAADSGITSIDQLAGEAICAGTSTTYEFWLRGDMEGLGLPESSVYASVPADVTVVTLATDQECAQAIEAGRRDFVAYVTSDTVVDANIAAGLPVLKLDGAVFSEDLAAAFDKTSTLSNTTLVAKVSEAITAMHNDGRLTELSNQWFGMDITKVP